MEEEGTFLTRSNFLLSNPLCGGENGNAVTGASEDGCAYWARFGKTGCAALKRILLRVLLPVADSYGAWTDRVCLETGAPPVRKGEYKIAGRLSLCLFSHAANPSFFIFLVDKA
jgi:hypothetical protein